ncbi:MAG: hypothetical protein ABR508_04845 [Candidatus Baltobacteraceae bacterium]
MNRIVLAIAAFGSLALLPSVAHAQVPKTGPTPNPAVSMPPAMPPITKREVFVSGGYLIPAIVCNQLTAVSCSAGTRYGSHYFRGAAELPLGQSLTGLVAVDYRLFHYSDATGTAIPADEEVDVRAGLRVLEPRLYLAVSYLRRNNDYGAPRLNAIGFGAEKLADTDQTFSLYGGAYYYPNIQGVYHELRYDMGVTLKTSQHAPLFLQLGYLGDHTRSAGTAPANEVRSGPYAGIGLTLP